VSAAARLHDLDGRVIAESDGDEIVAPLDAFGYDVFLLDVGGNRYVMTRTESLAPLLDLPPTTLRLSRVSNKLQLANAGGVAAIGVVTDGDVLELLPGEEVEIEGERAEGWNARV
jgi:hypothetical protein